MKVIRILIVICSLVFLIKVCCLFFYGYFYISVFVVCVFVWLLNCVIRDVDLRFCWVEEVWFL